MIEKLENIGEWPIQNQSFVQNPIAPLRTRRPANSWITLAAIAILNKYTQKMQAFQAEKKYQLQKTLRGEPKQKVGDITFWQFQSNGNGIDIM